MKNAKGLGFNPDNKTSREMNKIAYNKTRRTIQANDAWRVAKSNDPSIENRLTFVEFKREYFKRIRSK